MSINETLDENKNSIELALVNFLKNGMNDISIEESVLLKIGATLVTEIPFAQYLEMGYALDEFEEKNSNSNQSKNAIIKINKIINNHKTSLINSLTKLKEKNAFIKYEEFLNKLIEKIIGVKESIVVYFYDSSVLNEMQQPKYHYTAVMPKELVEKIIEWLEKKGITHFTTETNEFVVECGTRDELYAFDKFLSRSIEKEHYMVDFKISEAKNKSPTGVTSYDLARTVKPRFDQTQTPKAGAFDKDTKTQLKKKNPNDRRAMKHKGKIYANEEKFVLDESVLGMTNIPTISRLQALAGVPQTDESQSIAENEEKFDGTYELELIMNQLEEIESEINGLTPSQMQQVIERMVSIVNTPRIL